MESNYTELSRFGGRFQVMGMNNSMFSTTDLLDAELQILDFQAEPQRQKKGILEQEKSVWQSFKNDFKAMTDAFSDVRLYNAGEKQMSYSKDGFVSFEANASSMSAEYDVTISQLAQKHQVAGIDMGDADTALNLSDTVKINNTDLTITTDMTLRDIVNTVNGGDYNASASIIANRLVITAKDSGVSNAVTMTDGANGSLQTLGVLNADGTYANELRAAQNSKYTINGIALENSSNTISDAIDGVTVTLQNLTTEAVRVDVKDDTDATVAKIEEFVNEFNKGIMNLQKYTEEGTLLQGQSLPLKMRTEMSQIINYTGSSGEKLYEVGIEIDGTMKDGTLKFDKEKLKEELAKDPQKIQDLFFGETGVAKYMKDKMEKFTSETGSISTKIDGLDNSLEDVNEFLDRFDAQYELQKEALIKKYSEFETIMGRLNSELAYMEAQMSALSGSNKK